MVFRNFAFKIDAFIKTDGRAGLGQLIKTDESDMLANIAVF